MQERRGKRQLRAGDGAILYTLLEQLGAAGVVRLRKAQPPNSPFDRIERRFTVYLEQERGLASATVGKYLAVARRFLRERFGAEAIRCAEVNSRDVSGFVLRHACEHTPKGAQLMITSLRAFPRFLYLCGETKTNLAAALLAVAQWPMATLPKSLEPEQVESVLAHCERHKAGGQRDYAILLLLARLGLRAGEVVGLTLDDINWDAGELTIRGKGARHHRLPLTQEVGEALATYLDKGRPACTTRRVFIRTKAPRKGFASSVAIDDIVRRALFRAEVHPSRKGAHLFRHSLACVLLKKGASLGEIGKILRHQRVDTTALYAKVDLASLEALVRPWPGGHS